MNEIIAEVLENHPNHFSEKRSETHSYAVDVCTTRQHNNISTNECEAYGYFDNNATVKPEEIIYVNESYFICTIDSTLFWICVVLVLVRIHVHIICV